MTVHIYRTNFKGREIYKFESIRGPGEREGRVRFVEWALRPAFKLTVPDGTRVCRGRVCSTAIMLPGREGPIDADDAVQRADELGLTPGPIVSPAPGNVQPR